MKLNICDVCYYENKDIEPKPIIKSEFKISYKNAAHTERLSLDTCESHSHFFKVCENFEEARKKVNKLYGI